MEQLRQVIDQFMNAKRFAVAGASEDPDKYGHKCFVALINAGFTVFPINPRVKTVMGSPAYATLAALPAGVESLSIVTPPAVTERLLEEAIAAGVQTIWIQPGAEPENDAAISRARDAGLRIISGGPCLLVELAIHRRIKQK
jgi:predicted CoA-binding protein